MLLQSASFASVTPTLSLANSLSDSAKSIENGKEKNEGDDRILYNHGKNMLFVDGFVEGRASDSLYLLQ